MFSSANTAVFRVLLAVVLLAPLPLGSNRPWAWTLMGVLVGLLLTAWAVLVLAGKARAPISFARIMPVAVPVGLVMGWAAVQTLGIVPASLRHPLWAEAAAVLGQPVGGAVSVDPAMTLTAMLRLASYAGIFWLAVQLGRERSRAREALVAVALGGVAYAAYGLLVHFAGWESILWLDKWAYLGDLTATFVNRNAYGAYAGLGVLCCAALFTHALHPPPKGDERRASDLAEAVLVRALPFLLGVLVLGTALLLSHSRGAFLSTGAATAVLLVVLAAGRVTRPRTALLLGMVLLGVGLAVMSVSGDVTVERLVQTGSQRMEQARPEAYRLTAGAIIDAPLTGHGYGAFLPAFRMYRDTALPDSGVWDYAHNVHLEAAMDLGLPAAVLLYAALAVVLAACARGLLRRRRDQVYPAVAIAAAALLGVHGLVDFSVQMPAIAATLALLLGIGYAHAWRTSETQGGA